MSAGSLVSFMLYQQSLSSAFSQIGDVFSALTAAVGAAEKVQCRAHGTCLERCHACACMHAGGMHDAIMHEGWHACVGATRVRVRVRSST